MRARSPVPERGYPHAEWKLQKRSRACAACGRPFSWGEKYYSVLIVEGECFRRSDYCCSCWPEAREGGEGPFSLWQGKFLEEEPARKTEAVESTRAENLLAWLVRSMEPRFLKLAYVFALLLERKRKLLRRGRAEREGRVYIIYEQPGTGQAFMVEDMDINLSEAEGLQEDLNQILAGESIKPENNLVALSNGDADEGKSNQR